MDGARFRIAWVFIFLAAGYDGYFAWQYRGVLPEWEQNPLACWAATRFGLPAVLAFKFSALAAAAGLVGYCHTHRRWGAVAATVIIGAAHAALIACYVAGYQQPDEPRVALNRPAAAVRTLAR